MEETKDQVQLDDSILLRTISSGCLSDINNLLKLCDHKTTPFSSHALNLAVLQACNIGNAHLLQFLLQDGIRLELRDGNGNTPLLISSTKGFTDVVVKLLSMGADINAKNNNGDTALMLATSREVIQFLLENQHLQPHAQNSTGNTALISAIEKSYVEKVELLINAVVNLNRQVSKSTLTLQPGCLVSSSVESVIECAVSQAFESNNTKALIFLISECGAHSTAVIQKPETFLKAVKLGDIQLIELMLDSGLDVDRVHDSKTPLMCAVHLEVINFLLNKGANVNFKTNTTPLINALSWNYFSDIYRAFHPQLSSKEMEEKIILVADSFLKHGAHLEDVDECGCTALIEASKGCFSADVLKYLLDKGVNINKKENEGLTALHFAAKYHKFDLAEVLLKYGALVNLKSCDGCTPLHHAVRDLHIVKLFLENRANVNSEDDLGNTPLSLASKFSGDRVNVVQLLISYGSDVNHKNISGMSPLWLAAQNLNTKCFELLLNAKADLGPDQLQQKSALSILLNKWLPSEQAQRMAETLIDHGASAEFVRPDVIHRLIASGNDGTLVQKLMKAGICPTVLVLKKTIFNWPETSISPLAVSLILDSVDFTHYIINNWYLTKSDIKILSRNKEILNCLEKHKTKTLPYLQEVSQQPMRLELLSFITISSALGSNRDRHQRVRNSRLPVPFQDKLLFTKLEVKVLDAIVGRGLIFLHQLTKYQAEQEDKDSQFYELYVDFCKRYSSCRHDRLSVPSTLSRLGINIKYLKGQ
ncbi:ankyrin repeat and KH domain-containing protein 1 [Biomphalaria glabrata]|uniref:Ankyrin repeat and KH domain-containing protein 1-like n=1 Tax=Biomphalaria glabrata TaxID=6526 RepID=A0A9W3B0L5_BIOGL|nr:ankyrin repeat and KH domain-containing protein 1-like [Biomphalaria glabrata]XP_013061573.2 ankyrin repeat and KH domain-containing protein 1-like [Biomphalaria glabrata]XP_055893013.1 ankyrin repeat and KH domain-containing protein 1-like [Biomphalaria glabrata]KAI8763688.1 ankyrin repeat and KH domain-containing protein 1-like [Biomphalaria glabrata]